MKLNFVDEQCAVALNQFAVSFLEEAPHLAQVQKHGSKSIRLFNALSIQGKVKRKKDNDS